jgi:DNA-binding SARP family transcriptional activator/tetratricopeptide (TPR) repeat protein
MLHICVLGEQTIAGGRARMVRSRSSRSVALIGYLAAHAESPQPRQLIAGLFWPDSSDAQALTNLRRELHNLRQVLGNEPSLVVTPRDLCWADRATCTVDLRVFATERAAALAAEAAVDNAGVIEHAARAIGAYRGEFLPGAYDDWLLELRSDLERQCAGLCDVLAAARAAAGDLAGAVAAARRRIQLQALEETGYRTLMRLQADLGDRAGALSTYHHCASVLERELGVDPDPATRAVLTELMAGADAGEARRDVAGPPLQAAPAARVSGRPELVGRSGELASLRARWSAAAAGRPGAVVVRGAAGLGKTRLVSEVAALARAQGAAVASAQCFGSGGRLALAPVADWLRSPAIQRSFAGLDPAWRDEVARLVPSGQPQGETTSSSRALVDAWQRHRFFEGLARALIGADRPVLLTLDNLHWCDEETLAFLSFCLTLEPGARILVAATLREEDKDFEAELSDWIARLRAGGLLAELPLVPFEQADTARLAGLIAGRTLGDPDAALLHATTGGFPLYIVEAMRASQDSCGGSRPVGDLTSVLNGRLAALTAQAREIACLAAATGTDFTLDLLAESSDLDTGAVVRAVDELWQRRIVRESGDGYDFSHDLLRDAAYAQVSPPRRWLLHRRIAQGLELLHPDGADQVAAHLADQYARGGRPDRAVTFYARAAELASRVFAHAEAIRLYRRALSVLAGLPEGVERDSRELAMLQALAAPMNARYGYSSPELQRVLERAIELSESLGRAETTLTGLVALFATQFVQGRTAESYRTGMRAMELAAPDSELAAYAHFCVGGAAISMGRPAEGLRHLDVAAAAGPGAVMLSVGTYPGMHGTAWKSHAHWLLGQQDEALAAVRDAASMARSLGHPYGLVLTSAYAAVIYQLCGYSGELRQAVGELRALCGRYDIAYYREWGLVLEGWLRGDPSGIDLIRQGIGNLRAQLSLARMPFWLSLLADALVRCGQPDSARAVLDAALVTGQSHEDLWWLPEVLRMRAALEPDEQEAIARLRSAAGLAAAHGSVALLLRCERDLAGLGVRPAEASVRLPS